MSLIPHHTVLVLGAGFSGIAAAIALQRAGIDDFRLLERASTLGGTWRDNVYPGAACDTPSHLYSLSSALDPGWSRLYSGQAEIEAYMKRVAARHHLHEKITCNAEVIRASFDAEQGRWQVTTRGADGAHNELTARFLVSAIGELKDPHYPDIPGLRDFSGELLHSARWRPDVALEGRRVAIIGSGASAIQLVPQLVDRCHTLHLYQRTPPFVVPREDRAYSALERALFAHVPGLMRAYRWKLFLGRELRYPFIFARDWLTPIAERVALAHLERQVPDEALRQKLTPRYRIGCKRVLLSDDWYPALTRPNVAVHTSRITHVTGEHVHLEGGASQQVDAIVCCTGFRVEEPLGQMEVFGRDGESLEAAWQGRPSAYLGITSPVTPNAFFLLGPNTGLGHNSVLLMIEAQVRYMVQAIRHMRQHPHATLTLRQAVHDGALEELRHRHRHQVWASGCESWYLTDGGKGENFALWPGSVLDYMWRTRRFDPSCYHIA